MGRGIVVAIVLVVVALAAGGAWWMLAGRSGSPVRVMVALRGSVNEQANHLLVQQMVDEIAERGFDAQAAPAPITAEGAAGYTQALDAADDLDAGYTLLLDLSVTRVRDGLELGTALYDGALTGTLLPITIEPGTIPRSRRVEFAFERTSELDLAAFLRDTWVDVISADVTGWIYADRDFQRRVLYGSLSMEEEARAIHLREHTEAMESRSHHIEHFEEYCATERAALAARATDEPNVVCVGDPCMQWTLIGTDAQGRALVQDVSRDPYVPIGGSLSWTEPPERVLAVPLDRAAEPTLVHQTGHFYGFGRTSSSGAWISLEPFALNALAVVVVPIEGSTVVAAVLAEHERTQATYPHPSGRGALALIRNHWYYLHDGERIVLPNMDTAMWVERAGAESVIVGASGATWIVVAADGSLEGEPVAIDGDANRSAHVFGVSGSEVWAELEGHGCALSRLDLATHTARETPLPACIDTPALVGDGRITGITRMVAGHAGPTGVPEVVVVDPDTAAIVAVTTGPLQEEVVYVTHEATPRLVFNRRLDPWPADANLQIHRRVVCWADLPPR